MNHFDVLRAIRKMEPAWEKVTECKFAVSEYKDSTGRTLPCYSPTDIGAPFGLEGRDLNSFLCGLGVVYNV